MMMYNKGTPLTNPDLLAEYIMLKLFTNPDLLAEMKAGHLAVIQTLIMAFKKLIGGNENIVYLNLFFLKIF